QHDAHVLALGIESDPQLPEGEFARLPEVVEWVLAEGGVPYLAHTYWSGLRTGQFEACDGLAEIESYNARCGLEGGRGACRLHCDEADAQGRRVYGIGPGVSPHPGCDSGCASVWARCSERWQGGVLASLRAGRFYSSAGPEIHELALEDGAATVRCS